MSIEFPCGQCGRKLRSDEQYAGRPTACPSCRAILMIPEAAPVQPMATAITTADPPPLPAEGAIRPGPPNGCPECGAALGEKSVLCIECGYDLRTRKKRRTKKRRLKRKFDRSMPLGGRITVCVFTAFLPTMVMIKAHAFIWWLVPPALFLFVTFASPYGYVFRITVRRNRAGDLVLRKEHWVCLLPLDNWSAKLAGYTEAWTDYGVTVTYSTSGHVRQVEHYVLEIRGEGKTPHLIYDGPDGDFMRDLADVLQVDAGMAIKRK